MFAPEVRMSAARVAVRELLDEALRPQRATDRRLKIKRRIRTGEADRAGGGEQHSHLAKTLRKRTKPEGMQKRIQGKRHAFFARPLRMLIHAQDEDRSDL